MVTQDHVESLEDEMESMAARQQEEMVEAVAYYSEQAVLDLTNSLIRLERKVLLMNDVEDIHELFQEFMDDIAPDRDSDSDHCEV